MLVDMLYEHKAQSIPNAVSSTLWRILLWSSVAGSTTVGATSVGSAGNEDDIRSCVRMCY